MDDVTPTDRPGPGPRPGPGRRPRDMLISLLILLIPILVLIGGYQLISGRTQPVEIDPGSVLAEARSAGFEVIEPAGLGPEWVPVSATFQPAEVGATLRLGYVTPAGGSAQLVQSTVPAEELLADQVGGAGPPTGTVEVAGRSWQRFTTRPGEQTLVLLEPDRTILVIGTAPDSELRTLAAAATP